MAVGPERATALALCGVGAFQALLAAGVPWGNVSWGGKHGGVLPDHLRAISGVAAVTYVGTAGFIASGKGSPRLRSRTLTGISVWMGLGSIINAMSPARAERLVWTPSCAATAALAWRAGR